MTLATQERPDVMDATRIAELSLDFIVDGVIPREDARRMAGARQEDRLAALALVDTLRDDDLSTGENQRLAFATRLLSELFVERTVFVETAASRIELAPKAGLGTRCWTEGRHSSGYTFGTSQPK